ncbi:hypothetical protein UFOVP1298_54 [uncultured Caudovirales phage]|uniref:Uncharacterized protein n=1 Tax=uncultured Caudovirales phage TaxID=2100421 RepID=A0A6J5RUJ2_9CAUD|nr:hypothetical protein UFOVP1298_54 [uncultured Caudovirales phage]
MNEYQKNFDKFLKILCYFFVAWWFLDLLSHLPVEAADKLLGALFGSKK